MEITRGKQAKAERIVVYGPEGIGKSTFASQFPEALYIDIEGSTNEIDVARLPTPTSWSMIVQEINHIKKNPNICKTLVIDTADWAEKLCVEHVCGSEGKDSIEDFGYGAGYTKLAEQFGRFLNALTEVNDLGINVVVTAHAQMRKFEQPEETGSYDRWELKLQKKTAPLLKEWATMVLFANYKTLVITDEKTKKAKAQGGKRVMYTSHHACWDAKNRKDLPEEMPFNFKGLEPYLSVIKPVEPVKEEIKEEPKAEATISKKEIVKEEKAPEKPKEEKEAKKETPKESKSVSSEKETLLSKVMDLMDNDNITIEEIQGAVTKKGYYPKGTPVENYTEEFLKGVIIGAWDKIKKFIEEEIKEVETPF